LRNPGNTTKNGVSSFVFIAERIGPEVCSAQDQDGKKVGAFITRVKYHFCFISCRRPGNVANQLSYDFVIVSMLYSFAKFGSVLFSQSEVLNPIGSFLAPALVENLHNFATFRYSAASKKILNYPISAVCLFFRYVSRMLAVAIS
jgi:hypothetical protein